MGGVDTRDRYHVHWGAAEQYAERREESALRRSGPAGARPGVRPLRADRPGAARRDPRASTTTTRPRCWRILEATQEAYGYLPVAALKHISHATGAWYARSTASPPSTRHLRFEPPAATRAGAPRCAARIGRRRGRTYLAALPTRGRPAAARGPAEAAARDGDATSRWPTASSTPGRAGRRSCLPSATGAADSDRPRRRRSRPGAFDGPARTARPRPAAPTGARSRRGRDVRPARPRRRRLPDRPTSGAPRPRRRGTGRYVVANGYEADPASRHGPDAMEPDPVRVLEGAGARRLRRRRRRRRSSRSAPRTTDGDPAARGGHRGGRGGGLPRRRRARHRHASSRSRSGRSRAPSCWARRPSCCRPSRASAASPSSGRRIPPSAACWGHPTVVNNVADPRRACPGSWPTAPDAFAAIGSPDAARARSLVQLSGAVRRPGIAEVPLGTPLREIVD